MTNAYNTAKRLLTYLNVTRQVGHTTAMLNGAKSQPSIVVTHSADWSKALERKHKNIIGISLTAIDNGHLEGHHRPILLDNAATQVLLSELVSQIAALRADNDSYRKENTALIDKIKLAKAILG